MKKACIFAGLLTLSCFLLHNFRYPPLSLAANCDPSSCSNLADDQRQPCLNDQISQCTTQLETARKQENTLKSQLSIIDGQTRITALKIDETNFKIEKLKREISDLRGRIEKISLTLDSLSQILLNRIVQTYKYSDIGTIDLLFSSHGFADLIERIKYVQIIQAYHKKKLYELQATKFTYNDQRQDRQTRQAEAEKLSKDLEVYQKQLENQKKQKDDLLKATQNNESTYQKLLAQAQAQLAGFERFTQGKASILTDQTVCDDWGCYYNQRDAKWGNASLNNSQYSIASDGCLVTSMAMIYTHYGYKNVTPLSINVNPSNFASYFPAYLNYPINTNGVSATRQKLSSYYSAEIIDSELSAGRPVIVGIGSGPDHFVVFISGSNGNYKINDPFYPKDEGGHNANFTDHYSLSSIHEIDKVVF